jgi:hypothetical protein
LSEGDTPFCRTATLAIAAPIGATATSDTDVWFVLEYCGPWAAKAWNAAELRPEVRAHVDAFAAERPRARIQLVRRTESRETKSPELVLASSRPDARHAARWCLGGYDDIRAIDLGRALDTLRAGDVPDDAEALAKPMLLVCTNGKRDRCCAKWGLPIYEALKARSDACVWQTTHVGGHRYAPTLVWLPEGLCFGRVPHDGAAQLVDGLAAGSLVDLDWYRGRTALSEPAQAVEHAVRVASGALGVGEVVVDEVVEAGDEVRGLARAGGIPWRVELEREIGAELAPPSCGKPPEPVHRWRTIACARAD